MARPAKPISVTTGARTKEELTIRAEVEQSLNSGKPPKPPKYLTQEQKKIFKEILKKSVRVWRYVPLIFGFWPKHLSRLIN